ncbi:MAG: hypothetical protein GXC70_09980, partial [Sphingomonadaceae bacterium]|nr:hypothetical protein [Sphingomonadaceae bacterium]
FPMFDLNQLFASHQTALFNADQADCPRERQVWRDLVDFFAERIGRQREQRNLPAYRWA